MYLFLFVVMFCVCSCIETRDIDNGMNMMKMTSLNVLQHLDKSKKIFAKFSNNVDENLPSAAKSCCCPSSWQAVIAQHNPELLYIRYIDDKLQQITYDSYNMMRYMYIFYKNGTATVYTINLQTKLCQKQTVQQRYYQLNIQCIPVHAINRGKITFGAGSEVLLMEDWIWPAEQAPYVYERVTTAKNCYPVSDLAYSQTNGTYIGSLSYLNMTFPVQDKTVFKPPTYCQQADDYQGISPRSQPFNWLNIIFS